MDERVDTIGHEIAAWAMTGIAVMNEGSDDEPIVVPIARVSLGEGSRR